MNMRGRIYLKIQQKLDLQRRKDKEAHRLKLTSNDDVIYKDKDNNQYMWDYSKSTFVKNT